MALMTRKPKTTRERIKAAADEAVSTVQPAAETALEKVGTATEQAISSVAATVGPAISEAKEKITPLAEQAVAEGKKQGRRAAAKSRRAAAKYGLVEEEPKPSHKLRNLLILVGLGGVIAVAVKKFTGKDADPAWTATRDSAAANDVSRPLSPVAAEGASTAPVDGSETAPTAPLASEESVESPVPTTPDQPLEKKDL